MDEDEMRRAERVASSIEKVLRGQIKLSEAVDARGGIAKGRETFPVVPDVIIDNSLSQGFTVLEVSGLDRPGFLYDLTRRISDLNLNIASAHIATFGEKAVDVFYVTDLTGQKVTNVARQQAIRRHLIESLAGSPKPRAAKAPARADA
jgi:[protein-PII] uridylyltransferase